MNETLANAPIYLDAFYEGQRDGSMRSAEAVIPFVLDLVKPASVIDVGCGTGSWLAVAAKYGIEDYLGIDQEWVNLESLVIPKGKFKTQDLEKPWRLDRTFDLVMSLEVAEHLAPEAAQEVVKTLTCLGPVILFSAAVPGQGGIHHVNEQWPEYWAELFAAHGYLPVDALRPQLWSRDDVEWWYLQNMMLFVEKGELESRVMTPVTQCFGAPYLTRIHPELYLKVFRKWEASVRRSDVQVWPIRKLLHALVNALWCKVSRP